MQRQGLPHRVTLSHSGPMSLDRVATQGKRVCCLEQADLPQPELRGQVHTQHPVLEVLEQTPGLA